MIKHIVLWKLDESYSFEEKQNILEIFSDKLFNLVGKIEELKSLSVHLNSKEASSSNYDIMLETTFNSFIDLDTYQIHPEHQKVVEYVKSLKRQRACIDYEM
jgi:hypothetical protein